jgi:hypothetical protein
MLIALSAVFVGIKRHRDAGGGEQSGEQQESHRAWAPVGTTG